MALPQFTSDEHRALWIGKQEKRLLEAICEGFRSGTLKREDSSALFAKLGNTIEAHESGKIPFEKLVRRLRIIKRTISKASSAADPTKVLPSSVPKSGVSNGGVLVCGILGLCAVVAIASVLNSGSGTRRNSPTGGAKQRRGYESQLSNREELLLIEALEEEDEELRRVRSDWPDPSDRYRGR